MSVVSEFKDFISKGNVLDLAVAVIIAGAFAKITKSMVDDIIMPIVSFIMGGEFDFSNMFILLGDAPEGTVMTYEALKEAGVPMLTYGNFITVTINFIILAFIIFMMVKVVNNMRKKEEAVEEKPAEPSEEILLLREISEKLNK